MHCQHDLLMRNVMLRLLRLFLLSTVLTMTIKTNRNYELKTISIFLPSFLFSGLPSCLYCWHTLLNYFTSQLAFRPIPTKKDTDTKTELRWDTLHVLCRFNLAANSGVLLRWNSQLQLITLLHFNSFCIIKSYAWPKKTPFYHFDRWIMHQIETLTYSFRTSSRKLVFRNSPFEFK